MSSFSGRTKNFVYLSKYKYAARAISAHILKLEQVYLSQMAPIRQRMFAFGRTRGFSPLRRGRHPHASIFGVVNRLPSVIDFEMAIDSWDTAPSRIELAAPFTVYATVFQDTSEGRRVDPNPFVIQTNFVSLSQHVDHYLLSAWRHLLSRTTQHLQLHRSGAA